eukprot:1157114-Pelagomonas_calceolata.AAC.10
MKLATPSCTGQCPHHRGLACKSQAKNKNRLGGVGKSLLEEGRCLPPLPLPALYDQPPFKWWNQMVESER